ncbi:MAG: 50S ribosomal protein L20 [Firmicutes bacterium]|nr:50S ribosomal protein L20 [Bacillota bacterium]
MPRAKGGIVTHRRHKKILRRARGYFQARRSMFGPANAQVLKSLNYAFFHRRQRKRVFRQLWIARINAAARSNGMTYNRLIEGLHKAGITVNRKILAELAVQDTAAFAALVDKAKASLQA